MSPARTGLSLLDTSTRLALMPYERSCAARFELLIRITLNDPGFGSRNAELSE